MANINAVGYADPAKTEGWAGQKIVAWKEVAATTGNLALNDTFTMFQMPADAIVLGAILKADDLDTNGTPTLTLDVGDSDDPNRYISASTVGQASGLDVTLAATGAFYRIGTNTGDETIIVTASAAAATAAAGSIWVGLEYVMDRS